MMTVTFSKKRRGRFHFAGQYTAGDKFYTELQCIAPQNGTCPSFFLKIIVFLIRVRTINKRKNELDTEINFYS